MRTLRAFERILCIFSDWYTPYLKLHYFAYSSVRKQQIRIFEEKIGRSQHFHSWFWLKRSLTTSYFSEAWLLQLNYFWTTTAWLLLTNTSLTTSGFITQSESSYDYASESFSSKLFLWMTINLGNQFRLGGQALQCYFCYFACWKMSPLTR